MHRAIQEKSAQLEALCVRFRVRRLALFGSAAAASGPAVPRDFDFLVEFAAMKPVEHAACYFGLLEELESLLRAPVDLVEPRAIRNPYFQRALEETQVPLYAAA